MYSTELQARFTKSCMDAMLGYMTATTASSAATMGHMLDFWGNTARVMSGGSPRSGMGTGQWPMAMPAAGPFPWLPMPGAMPVAMLNPVDLWMSMTPFGRSPFVLQMAFAMMTFGVPRDVAMPAAEANAAALDAAEAAAGPFKTMFSAYRSEGGHASAQIVFAQKFAAALMMSPFGAAMLQPWMAGSRVHGF